MSSSSMAPTLQRPLPPMEVISVDGETSSTVNLIDRANDWRSLISRALGKSGISHKRAAAEMQIDPGLLSAQMNGVPGKHVSWSRLGLLPREFWQELVLLLIEFHGLSVGASPRDLEDQQIGRAVREVISRCR